MTDRQKLLTALVSEPDTIVGRLSVLDVVAMLEQLRDEQREGVLTTT